MADILYERDGKFVDSSGIEIKLDYLELKLVEPASVISGTRTTALLPETIARTKDDALNRCKKLKLDYFFIKATPFGSIGEDFFWQMTINYYVRKNS